MKIATLILLIFCSISTVYTQKILPTSVEDKKTRDSIEAVSFKANDIIIQADRIYSAASDNVFRTQNLQLLPRSSTQDMLRIVPGLVTAQHAGGGKAEQIFLRGFDCDHGTDININVDGAPVNMVSHGHGQGYADLHFIIPETIELVEVVKGPYNASFGDLTTAGAVTFRTADTLSGNTVKLEIGSFNTLRGLGLLTTTLGKTKSYGGVELFSTRNFFDAPQDLFRLNYIGKFLIPLSKNSTVTASLLGFSSRWNASGQIPDRAVESGFISRYGTIDPNEGGNTIRTTAQVNLTTTGDSPMKCNASFTKYQFQLYSNFTFFAKDSIRGDMIEQIDNRSVTYLHGEKEFFSMLSGIGMKTKLGTDFRHDDIRAALYHDSARVRLETTRDNTISQTNLGVFVENSFLLSDFSFQIGLRGDYIGVDVQNLTSDASGSQGTSNKFILSPKANATLLINPQSTLFLNAGFGFHSNDARAAVRTPSNSTIPRAFGSEIGIRWADEVIAVSAAGWMLDLENEFIWIGDEGTTEENGRSRRLGVDIEARCTALSWLTLGTELTVSRGRLVDEPEGQNYIALAPNLTLTAFASLRYETLSASIRLRHIGLRPANEDYSRSAKGYTILDATALLTLSTYFDISLQCENILNSQWREAQFDTSSRLQSEKEAVTEVHYTPGTKANLRIGLSAKL